jgi:hypothetical protein
VLTLVTTETGAVVSAGACQPGAIANVNVSVTGSAYLTCANGNTRFRLTSTKPAIVIDSPQQSWLRAVYSGSSLGTFTVTSTETAVEHVDEAMRGCEVTVVDVPVTATLSICPPPSCFTWLGSTYNSIAALVADVRVLVPSVSYNANTCTFSAPSTAVLPNMTIAACVPVTSTLSICPPPACFTWSGTTYNSVADLVADVRVLVPSVSYDATTCTFSAPSPATLPVMTLVACVAEVVYCASLRIDSGNCTDLSCCEIGYAYRDGDVVDPLATVAVTNCAGANDGFIYPTAGVGHTVPYYDGGAVVLGYLSNQSTCAPDQVSLVSSSSTTDVKVVAASVAPNGIVTLTLSDGSTIISNEPAAPVC